MTVVSPGYSSFLITHIVDEKNALSMATMPHIITSTLYFPVNSWFLYNFGTTTGRTWNISVRPCNYWVQQDDNDVISPSIVKYIDMGNEENYEIKLMPITKGMRILHIPPVGVIVGNPALLEVTTEGYFDITDSYHMKVHIASKFFQKGSTSLALVVWEASSQCYLTTLVPTMKSSCSYLRTMHHIPGRHIPPEHWISGVHKDSQGFNMIKTLPSQVGFPDISLGTKSSPLSRSAVSVGFTSLVWTPLLITHSSLQLDSSSVQCLAVGVCFYFHQLLDEGYRMAYKKLANTNNVLTLGIGQCATAQNIKSFHMLLLSQIAKKRNLDSVVQGQICDLNCRAGETDQWLKGCTALAEEPYQAAHLTVTQAAGCPMPVSPGPGSELFHFKVSVIPGVSFCDLHEEFQIYVDEVPLPFPGHVLIAVATSVVLGGLIFVAFLFQLRNIHPLRAFRRYVRGTIAHSSNLSIDS
ncbi:cation channel sperm associated auxiliary subunit beta [Cricetulus griseus]